MAESIMRPYDGVSIDHQGDKMGLLQSLKMEDEKKDESKSVNGVEFGSKFEPDPEPGHPATSRRRTRKPAAQPAAGMSPTRIKALSREVGGQIAGLIDMTGTLWEMTGDTCCAPVVQEQSGPVGDALAACLARNPELLARMADVDFVTMILQIGALGKALQPIGTAIW